MLALSKLRVAASRLKPNQSVVRHGGTWVYRQLSPTPSKKVMFMSEAAGAALWYWLLTHFWYQPEHVFGHYPYPDPSKWTDEELGIPPDDAE